MGINYLYFNVMVSKCTREHKIGQFLAKICEPYLEQFRKFIPPLGMIDISPIVGFLVLNFATSGFISLLIGLINESLMETS